MLRYTAVLLLLGVLVTGCETTPTDSIWDPDREALPTPTIDTVDPAEYWLAGVDEITITGSNFSSDPDDNLVYFDAQRASVVSASPNELVVRSPNYIAENAVLRVTVIGAREYSNELSYRLDPAVASQAGLGATEEAVAFTYHEGTLYASTTSGGIPSGVQALDIEARSAEQYAAPRAWRYTDLAYDDNTGDLYMARGTTPIIYRVPPGGGNDEVWLLRGGLGAVATVTVDDAGHIWAAGNNDEIYRVTQAQEVTPFPFDANVRAMVYANDALYLAAESGDVDGAWRIPLSATSEAGTPELLLDLGSEIGGSARAIEVASDGTVFVGTTAAEGIVQINPDGSWEPLHPGLLSPAIIALSYGEPSERYEGNILYALQEPVEGDNSILRLESLKQSR